MTNLKLTLIALFAFSGIAACSKQDGSDKAPPEPTATPAPTDSSSASATAVESTTSGNSSEAKGTDETSIAKLERTGETKGADAASAPKPEPSTLANETKGAGSVADESDTEGEPGDEALRTDSDSQEQESVSTAPDAAEIRIIEEPFPHGEPGVRVRRHVKVLPDGTEVPHGVYTEFRTDGSKWKQYHYVDGEKDGEFIEWYDNGRVSQIGEFDNGRLVGNWTWFYTNGMVDREGTFKDNVRHGFWRHYRPDGTLESEERYEDGQLVVD